MTKLIHPITFIDKLVKKNERGYSFSLMDHQPEICLGPSFNKDRRLPWGGTRFFIPDQEERQDHADGAITVSWGFTQEPPNEILILAKTLSRPLPACSGQWKASSSTISSGNAKQKSSPRASSRRWRFAK